MSDTATPEAAPTSDPVATIPDTGGDAGDFSFEAALEASINAVEAPAEETPAAEEAPVVEETKKEESAETEPAAEESTETEGEEKTEDTNDLLDALDADVGDDWTPKASAAFQRLKTELKSERVERETLTQRAKEAEAKVAELEGVVGSETVETLQQRVQEYENAQMVTNLEQTDAFKEAVMRPLEDLFSQVEKLAEVHSVDYESLVDAMTIEDATRQEEVVAELMATASDRDKAVFYRLAAEIDPILQRRDNLRSNAEEALNEANLVAEERNKITLAEKASQRVDVTKNVTQRIKDKVPFLSGFEGLDLEAIQKEAADVDPTVVHSVDFAYQAVAARLLPSMVKEYASSQKLIEELTKQLASYEDAEPKLSGGTNSAPLAGSASSSGDFASSIESLLAGS
jgi:hypothetical protein